MGDKKPTTVTDEQMAQFMALKAENEALKAKLASKSTLTGGMKVSEKGALSFYGLGRFPVTLYKSQWLKLIGAVPEIEAFIVANADKLTEKPAKVA